MLKSHTKSGIINNKDSEYEKNDVSPHDDLPLGKLVGTNSKRNLRQDKCRRYNMVV